MKLAAAGVYAQADRFVIGVRSNPRPGEYGLTARYLQSGEAAEQGAQVYYVAQILGPDTYRRLQDEVMTENCRRVMMDPAADSAHRAQCMQWVAFQEQIRLQQQQVAQQQAYQAQQAQFQQQQLDMQRRQMILQSIQTNRTKTVNCNPNGYGGVRCTED